MNVLRSLLAAAAALFLAALPPAARGADGAYVFNGSNQRVEAPAFHTLGVTNEATVEFWAYVAAAGDHSAFVLDPDSSTNRVQAHLAYSDGNTYWDFGNIAGGGRLSFPTPAGVVGTWRHFAFVVSQSGNFMRVYLDGTEVAAKTGRSAYSAATAATLRVGGASGVGFFPGRIDEFRVWNVARTQAQIRSTLGLNLAGHEAGLRLYYRFDETSGTVAENLATATGAAFDGTLVNAPARASGALTVNTTTDELQSPSGLNISLREALRDAAALPGPARLRFAPALSGSILPLATEVALSAPQGVEVDATNLPAGLTLQGGGTQRLLSLSSGSLTLRGLSLSGGGGEGAATPGQGGAIRNAGNLTLTQVTLSGNSAAFSGGAIYSTASSTLQLERVTLSGNAAVESLGGAIYHQGAATLTHCTVSANSATESGGGLYSAGPLSLAYCIVSGNSAQFGADVRNDATLTRTGTSFVGALSNAGTLAGSGTLDPAAPLLAGLAQNAGPTRTHALQAGSPARNAASGSATTADQRALPIFGVPDVGAWESQLPTLTNASTPEDMSTGARAFSVGSVGTLTAASSNAALVPNANLTLGGSGANRTLTAVPAPNANGTTTLTVSDAAAGDSTSFVLTVTPVNDAPSATNLSAAETYTEDTPLNLTDLVITDDSPSVTATLTLSNVGVGTLNTGNSGSTTSTFAAGVWTATGPVAEVNSLLAGVIFTPAPNFNGAFTMNTSVSDGVAPALTGSKAFTGVAVTDPPSATNLSAAETYTEDMAHPLNDIVITHPDGAAVTATLTLSNVSAGTLNTATAGGTTSTFVSGVWRASGPVANVNALLAGLIFTPAPNFNAAFTLTTSVTDGVAPALTGTKAFTGLPVNDPPTIDDMSGTSSGTGEDNPSTIVRNFSGVGPGPDAPQVLTVTATSSNPAIVPHPTVVYTSPSSTGSVRIPPRPANQFGNATITVTVTDDGPNPLSRSTSFGVSVVPVNDAPTFNAGGAQVVARQAPAQTVAFWATGFDPGPDNESDQTLVEYVISSNSNPALFSIPPAVGRDGTLTYTPALDQVGTAMVGVRARDSGGGGDLSAVRTLSIEVKDPLVVTTTADSGPGSLRDAVAIAAEGSTEVIVFAPSLSGQTILLSSEIQFDHPGGLVIDASALPAGVILSAGNNTNRIFRALPGNVARLVGLTLREADGGGDHGGAIFNAGRLALERCTFRANAVNGEDGSAIYNAGTLELARCLFAGNVARGVFGDTTAHGALYSTGLVRATGCTFTGNGVVGTGSGSAVAGTGTFLLSHCTFSGNSAAQGASSVISVLSGGSLSLVHCTVAGNASVTGVSVQSGAQVSLVHCILSDNQNSDLVTASPVQFLGPNIVRISDLSSGGSFTGTPPLTGDPLLGALASNGGFTQTRALGAGSPAIDASVNSDAVADQRGFPLAGLADLGAHESGTCGLAAMNEVVLFQNSPSAPLPYTVLREAGVNVTLTATSDNATLLPPAGLQLSDPTASGTLVLTPAANASGTALVTLTATVAGGPAFSTRFRLTVLPFAGTPFGQWRLTEFGLAGAADPLVSGPTADPEGDGLANFLEYATRTSPRTPGAAPLLGPVAVAGPARELTFAYRPTSNDIRYILERSTALIGTWTEIYRLDLAAQTVFEAPGVSAVENATTQVVTLTDATAPTPGTFWRLRVELAP